MTPLVAFIGPIGFSEMIIIGIIALLLYGGDLPKVAKSWGKTYQEFRRHLTGIQRDLNSAMYADDDTPPKLQYYPEFRDEHLNETSDAVVVDSPVEHYSPVAEAAMQADEAAQIAAADSGPAEDAADSNRADHGAA
jgi:sec-independent protein translocase protein TatA